MKEYVLEIENLTKTYKETEALKNINIKLEKGKIYGFIGRNGAGKTTLIRMIAGLGKPDCGSIKLFGETGKKSLIKARKRIGCIIEYPALYPNMTAKENLKLYRTMNGIPNMETEEELLKFVGLQNTGKKKAKDFSLGMKQKLGIAGALVGSPELLILDEPINGLDPVGIKEIRNMLLKLSSEKNVTILISSHILEELQHLVDEYIIINKGEIKEQISVKSLNEKCKKYLHLNSDEPERLTSILELALKTTNYKVMDDNSVRLYDYVEDKTKVAKALKDNDILITNLSCEGESIEDYFIDSIGGSYV